MLSHYHNHIALLSGVKTKKSNVSETHVSDVPNVDIFNVTIYRLLTKPVKSFDLCFLTSTGSISITLFLYTNFDFGIQLFNTDDNPSAFLLIAVFGDFLLAEFDIKPYVIGSVFRQSFIKSIPLYLASFSKESSKPTTDDFILE